MSTKSSRSAFIRIISVVFLLASLSLSPVRPPQRIASAQPEGPEIQAIEDQGAPALPPQPTAAPPRAPAADTVWTIETVESGGVGRFSSLAIDSADQLHVGYYDGENTALRYAAFDGTGWVTTTVDNSGSVGQHASLDLDDSESPHISYYQSEAGLRHAYITGTMWITELVDYTADVGEYNSLAVGTSYDDVLISYYDASNQRLRFARFYNSTWVSMTLDAGPGVGRYTALDAGRYPHIAYYDANNDNLKYVEGTSSGWDTSNSPVNHAGTGGLFASLALDSGIDPHVSYFDADDDELVYAHLNVGGWTDWVVDTVGSAVVHTAIAVDGDDRPHIAYTDDVNDTLLYAYFNGSSWVTETVDSSGSVGGYPSIVIDSEGYPHITYFHTVDGLKHAWMQLPSDLVVTDLWDDGGQIWYQVRNVGQGPAPAGHEVLLTIDGGGNVVDTVPVVLAPGERYEGTLSAWSCDGTSDDLSLTADRSGIVPESDETNNVRQETWDCDTVAPQITWGPTATLVLTDSVVVEWGTDENSDSWVYYDPSLIDYTTYEFDEGTDTAHQITLTGLTPATVYRYTVESNDLTGNRVTSGEHVFETAPLASATPLTGTIQIARGSGDYPTYDVSVVVDTSTTRAAAPDVDYVSFYMNDVLIGEARTPAVTNGDQAEYRFTVSPSRLGLDRDGFFVDPEDQAHELEATLVSVAGLDTDLIEYFGPPREERPIEVTLMTPNDGAVYYADPSGDLPPGTTIDLTAEATEYEWECEWVSFRGSDPYAMPPNCGDVAQKTGPVEFYVDGDWVGTLSTPESGTFTYILPWDASGLDVGSHTVTVVTRASDDIMNLVSATHQFEVVQPTVGLDVERTVTRHGNTFQVALDISLSPDAIGPALLDSLVDYTDELMPVHRETPTYTLSFEYPAWASSGERRAKITIDFASGDYDWIYLAPGNTHRVTYQVVPILYEDGQADPEIGMLDLKLYYTQQTQYSHAEYDLPWQTLSSVESALGTSDYVIVTNPDRLHDLYVEDEVHDLLGTMAHLATIRNGVLGFLETYVASYSTKRDDALQDLTDPGGYWAEMLHPNFQDTLEGYMLIVGETEVVPAFDSHDYDICWAIPDDSTHCRVGDNDVFHHDQWYATTSGNGKPELNVGRVIGDSAWQLERPLIVSIGVVEGDFHYDAPGNALVVSGRGNGSSFFESNVDYVDMVLDDIDDPIDDRWTVDVLNLPESYPDLALETGLSQDVSLAHLMGHGNVDSFADALCTSDPPDLYGYTPFFFAPSCLTGNYEAGDDYNLAESLFDQGASAYIGSTQVSPIQTNHNVSIHFYAEWNWEDGEALSRAFGQTERAFYDDWSYYDWYRFWAVEYNFYGDPKFGASGSAPALRVAAAPAATTAPTTTLHVQAPDYVVTPTVDGFDQVEIPGGRRLREGGLPEIPYWTVSVDYAPGYRVQDVDLTARGGHAFTTGLDLPTTVMTYYTDAPVSGGTTQTLNLTEDDDWFPALDQTYDWNVTLNPDGSSELQIHIFPFHYQPATTNVEWYDDFTFDIDVISATAEIDGFDLDAGIYEPGDVVTGDLWFETTGNAQDLILAATVRDMVTEDVIDSLALEALHDVAGPSTYSVEWDSAGVDPGQYLLWVDLLDSEGHLLDSASEMFRLGAPFAEMTAFSATPDAFQPGDAVDVSMTISNTGPVALSGEAMVKIYPAGVATPTANFTRTVTDLAPGAEFVLEDAWDTTGVTRGDYRVIGYVKYDARTTNVAVAEVTTQRRIYLPLVVRE